MQVEHPRTIYKKPQRKIMNKINQEILSLLPSFHFQIQPFLHTLGHCQVSSGCRRPPNLAFSTPAHITLADQRSQRKHLQPALGHEPLYLNLSTCLVGHNEKSPPLPFISDPSLPGPAEFLDYNPGLLYSTFLLAWVCAPFLWIPLNY